MTNPIPIAALLTAGSLFEAGSAGRATPGSMAEGGEISGLAGSAPDSGHRFDDPTLRIRIERL